MKIGIVTYTHCYNQGADLQAYALTHVLEKLGHSAEIVWFDRVPIGKLQRRKIARRAVVGRILHNPIKGALELLSLVRRRFVSHNTKTLLPDEVRKERVHRFDEFWEHDIPHSDKVKICDLSSLSYDGYIAGSDQIWNWRMTGDMSPYFLLFAPLAARRISYAASVSVDKIDRDFEDLYKRGLANLQAISVRETDGVDALKRLTAQPIEVVLDPTLLMTADDWRGIESGRISFSFPYIFSYTLNSSKEYLRLMLQYAHRKGLRVVNVSPVPSLVQDPLIENVCNAGPREFLYLLSHAECVFTNSFHGTAFAINYHKPFFSVLNPYSSTNSRILSIAKLLSLESRVFMSDAASVCDFENSSEVDFVAVDSRLEELKKASINFLTDAING